jgi:hypothetical protein
MAAQLRLTGVDELSLAHIALGVQRRAALRVPGHVDLIMHARAT